MPNHYAEANNLLIPDRYDASKPTSYILYTDCNNLYGAAMSQPLPYADFLWLNRDSKKFHTLLGNRQPKYLSL